MVILLRPILVVLLPLLYLDVFHGETSLLPIAQLKIFLHLLDCNSHQSMKWICGRLYNKYLVVNGFQKHKKLVLE